MKSTLLSIRIILALCLLNLFLPLNSTAQVPQGIPYQAVARNGQGQPLANANVKVRFSILDSTATGTAVYVESHNTTTSALGLFTANVGMGTPSTGTFNSINWGQNFKFLKVELDTTATGNNYIEIGTQQMLSVPYALFAANANFSLNGVPVGDQGEICISCWGKPVWSSNGLCPQINSTCGASDVLSSILNYGNVSDIDGNNYKTIKIGNQTWMAENLKVSHYKNGDSIPTISTLSSFPGPNLAYGARGWANNDSATYNCPYGALYNFYAQTNSNNVCPAGWHVSTKNDWDTLINFIGVKPAKKLKSIGSQYWNGGYYDELDLIGYGGSNKYGLSILPSGNGWTAVGEQANYFGIDSGNNPLYINFSFGGDSIYLVQFLCDTCFTSVRCVKD